MFIMVLRVLAVPTGLLAYYIAFFMFEDQEGRWQNRIENLWIAVNDREQLSGGKTSALFNAVAGVVTRVLNRIFGRKLVSFQFVGVSLSYSVAAMCFFVGLCLVALAVYIITHASALPDNLTKSLAAVSIVGLAALFIGCICLAIAAMPSLWPSRFSVALSLLPGLLVIYSGIRVIWFHQLSPAIAGMFVALVLGLLSDALLLILVRLTVRRVSAKPKVSQIAAAVLLQLGGVVFFVIVPIEAALHVQMKAGNHQPAAALAVFYFWLAVVNVFTGLASFLFSIVLVFVLIHKALWPTMSRLIYPLARFEVVRNHKLMAGVGTGCFIFAFPLMWTPIENILAWVAK